jgi:hypothetical protein
MRVMTGNRDSKKRDIHSEWKRGRNYINTYKRIGGEKILFIHKFIHIQIERENEWEWWRETGRVRGREKCVHRKGKERVKDSERII